MFVKNTLFSLAWNWCLFLALTLCLAAVIVQAQDDTEVIQPPDAGDVETMIPGLGGDRSPPGLIRRLMNLIKKYFFNNPFFKSIMDLLSGMINMLTGRTPSSRLTMNPDRIQLPARAKK